MSDLLKWDLFGLGDGIYILSDSLKWVPGHWPYLHMSDH